MNVLDELRRVLPPSALRTDPDVMAAYSRDQAPLCEAGSPVAVVLADDEETIAATLRACHGTATPVVVRGAGTGLSGGANALDGCVVLSVARMDRILEVDPAARIARVEPGVLNGALDAAAREHGLMYAPDPASRDISSIGGNVATNAGGACCLQYGVTGDHVLQLRALLIDGTPIHTGSRSAKDVAGLDLHRLLIGSEGTLAVVTEVTVRLLPVPVGHATLIAFFPSLAATGPAIVELAGMGALSKLELMDQTTVRAVEAMVQMDLDTEAAALLLAQADRSDAAEVIEAAVACCERHGATTTYSTDDEEEGRLLMRARSAALPALERMGRWLLDDVSVPIQRVPELVALCEEAARTHRVVIGTFGHAGDGNLHPTILWDPDDTTGETRARSAFVDIVQGAIALGGSITGEHGVGSLKQPYLAAMVGEREVALMRGIKAVFDPGGLLNPGRGI